MKKLHISHLVLVVLSLIAATLPIFGGYLMAFLSLLWLVRQVFRPVVLGPALNVEFATICKAVFGPILIGALLLTGLFVLANMLANGLAEEPATWTKVLSKMSHFGLKYLVLGYVLITAFYLLVRRGLRITQITAYVLAWFCLHTIYLLAQRQWGLDWTNGLDARLGPHRFAYDAYRLSGFMGHPLTLAYVLCLWIVASWSLRCITKHYQDRTEAAKWAAISGLCAFSLLISGSRFAMAVVPLVFLLIDGRKIFSHVKILAPMTLVVGLVLWWEGTFVGRMLEFFAINQDLAQKFPRLYFWQAHAAMFVDHPLAGVGLVGLKDALPAYYQQIGYHDKIYSAHNIYLQFLADSGLIGFAGLVCFLTGIAVAAARLRKFTGSMSLWGLLLVTMLSGTMQNVLRDSEFLYAFWILCTLVVLEAARGGIRQRA